MATVRKATHLTNLNTTENVVTTEIFGDDIRTEKARAKNALKDFARWYPEIQKNYKVFKGRIEACTHKGEVSKIMSEIRRHYI